MLAADWILLEYTVMLGNGGNQFPSVTMCSSGIQSAADADADARCGCSLVLCSHLTSAFASTSTSLSKFNIASTVMQT